jgi:hypothetical protein
VNSSRIWATSSRRSFSGNRRICSKISTALIVNGLRQTWSFGKFAARL